METWRIEASDIESARRAVREHVVRTRVVPAPALGPGVWLKLECEQHTGSFKLRGALAALARLPDGANGVVTASAGNHGYGLARAGALAGVAVTVCVSRHAPVVKREGMRAAGARIELIDARSYDDVEVAARALALAEGMPFVSPFDAPDVAAGNGATIGEEILEQLPEVATVVAPVGGGGLIAGLAAHRRIAGAKHRVIGVQSAACPAMVRSLEEGRPLLRYEGAATLAEGLEGGVSPSTFRAVRDEVDRVELVSEAAIGEAMLFARDRLDLRIEGSAAVVIAWLRERASSEPAPLVAVVTGSNVDLSVLDALAERAK